jgi:NAD(P)H-dependent FMN reductase
MALKILVLYGSYRTNRLGIRLAKYLTARGQARGWETTLVDAKEYDLPILDLRYKEYEAGKAPAKMEKLHQLMLQADGYVLVAGEYNHSVQSGLKNMLDHFYVEYTGKPMGIACYSGGSFGGVRAGVAWRATLGELRMVSIPTMYPIPAIQNSFDEAGKTLDPKADERSGKFLDELEWYASALQEARQKKLLA